LLAGALAGPILGLSTLMRRQPWLVNLPGGGRLDEVPAEHQAPVHAVLDGLLGLVLCETTVILGPDPCCSSDRVARRATDTSQPVPTQTRRLLVDLAVRGPSVS
jgi:hypothetical protein